MYVMSCAIEVSTIKVLLCLQARGLVSARAVSHLPDMQHALLHVKRSLSRVGQFITTANVLCLLCSQVLRPSLGLNLLTQHAVKKAITGNTESVAEGCSPAKHTVSKADRASSFTFVQSPSTDIAPSPRSPTVSLLGTKPGLELSNDVFFIALLSDKAAEGHTCSTIVMQLFFGC